jgi:hypothetical protein
MLGDRLISTSAWGTAVALVAECGPRNADTELRRSAEATAQRAERMTITARRQLSLL